jgi:glycosyltransferase involved in cell wall biosynthesis
MRILLANKFYYRRGGDCIYMINLEQLLTAHGHEVAVFAMDYPENLNTPWKKYFPSSMGKLSAFTRPFGDRETRRKFTALMDDFHPDVVHLNNIHTQLSPVIAEIAHQKNVKVVWTLHDYKLLCPRYDCLRNGENCELCFNPENKGNCLKYSCMKGGKIGSWIGYKEATKWNRARLEAATDCFICPSSFMADKMKQGGFNADKLKALCNFIDIEKCKRNDGYLKDNYYCFMGRLSHEKGAGTLISAASQLPYKLVVVGDGPLMGELKSRGHKNIEFVGHKDWDEIKRIVGKAKFSVIPSEWYENNPLSVIEAKCLGTPVLGARIGGIPELIEEGKNGMTFESKNVEDLKEKIALMWKASFDYKGIAEDAMKRYNAETYYQNIIKVFKCPIV